MTAWSSRAARRVLGQRANPPRFFALRFPEPGVPSVQVPDRHGQREQGLREHGSHETRPPMLTLAALYCGSCVADTINSHGVWLSDRVTLVCARSKDPRQGPRALP